MAWLLDDHDDHDDEVTEPGDLLDDEWPHGGLWSRGRDGQCRCAVHDLAIGQH